MMMIRIPTTMVLFLLVGSASATKKNRNKSKCPSGLTGAWVGTARLLPAGRIAIGACTQKEGDSEFTDMEGNPCTTTVCNNANIEIGASGKFCTLNVFGDECPGGDERDLFYKCKETKNVRGGGEVSFLYVPFVGYLSYSFIFAQCSMQPDIHVPIHQDCL